MPLNNFQKRLYQLIFYSNEGERWWQVSQSCGSADTEKRVTVEADSTGLTDVDVRKERNKGLLLKLWSEKLGDLWCLLLKWGSRFGSIGTDNSVADMSRVKHLLDSKGYHLRGKWGKTRLDIYIWESWRDRLAFKAMKLDEATQRESTWEKRTTFSDQDEKKKETEKYHSV